MGRCILHIGMHKTGTSSIQASLSGFADDRFVYADVGRRPNHSRALFDVVGFDARGQSAPTAQQGEVSAQELRRVFRAAGERTLILSGEGISILPAGKLERLRNFLRRFFDGVTIAGAVRAPAGYMASAFQEPVKRGASDSFELLRQYRSYRRTFEKFDQLFGPENVRLWKFDPATFPEGCAVRDFCSRFGVDLPRQRIKRHNESLSREAVGLLFTYRKLGRGLGSMAMSGAENLRLVSALSGIGGGKFRFAAEVMQPILEANRADIEWMERRLGQSLQEPLGEAGPADVRDEADLLAPDPRAVQQLRTLLGAKAPAGVRGDTAAEVAQLVHALREPRTGEAPEHLRRIDEVTTSVAELVRQLDGEPSGIAPEAAEALVGGVFGHICDTLAALPRDGAVEYAGLGRFATRAPRRAAGGPAAGTLRITFQRSDDERHRGAA